MFPIHDDNPIRIIPFLTYTIIAVCIAVFIYQFTRDLEVQQNLIYALGVIPAVIFGESSLPRGLVWVPAYATVFTSMFLHGGWMHLIGNMLYLWVFGNNIEAAMGHIKFIVFYLLCGVAAFLAQGLPDTSSQIPMIGASGAISGVLGAYLLLYPKVQVTVVIPIFVLLKTIRIPALYVLGVWFIMQLVSEWNAGDQQGGVAFGAHIGGFIAGMLLIPIFRNKNTPLQIPFVHFNPFKP
ncbi:MAG: rhomboid family intramembrane serine protease [Granulosicoccus sp.]|nr:rhomboid family intramembrane serine protease [Granulosicoccus sp.]